MTALLLAATAAIAGCGDDDEPRIPRSVAADIRAELILAKQRLRPLRCNDLDEESIPDLERQIARLPEDSDVRNTLEEGVDHLRSLVEAECADRREQQEETDTTDTTEPPTTTETTTAPPETTTPPETTPPETTPPETTPPETTPPDNDNGNGGQAVPQGSVKPKKPRRDEG
jgi:hypothetical protein